MNNLETKRFHCFNFSFVAALYSNIIHLWNSQVIPPFMVLWNLNSLSMFSYLSISCFILFRLDTVPIPGKNLRIIMVDANKCTFILLAPICSPSIFLRARTTLVISAYCTKAYADTAPCFLISISWKIQVNKTGQRNGFTSFLSLHEYSG